MSLQTTSIPADFEALAQTDLSGTTCVVLDILRATSSMITALANGAEQILPVATIEEALAAKAEHPEALLCGERDGLRITAAQTGKSVEQINEDGDRDRWFTAEEALAYGFVDHIREHAADVSGGGGTDTSPAAQ